MPSGNFRVNFDACIKSGTYLLINFNWYSRWWSPFIFHENLIFFDIFFPVLMPLNIWRKSSLNLFKTVLRLETVFFNDSVPSLSLFSIYAFSWFHLVKDQEHMRFYLFSSSRLTNLLVTVVHKNILQFLYLVLLAVKSSFLLWFL